MVIAFRLPVNRAHTPGPCLTLSLNAVGGNFARRYPQRRSINISPFWRMDRLIHFGWREPGQTMPRHAGNTDRK